MPTPQKPHSSDQTCATRAVAALLLLVITSAYGTVRAQPRPQATAAPSAGAARPPQSRDLRRFRADSFWVRTWLRGGDDEPELFVEPRQLVVAGGMVAILDLGTREIIALKRDSGRTQLTLSARGEGPGEFKRPARLLHLGDDFGVIDDATARLTMFAANGTRLWDAPMPDANVLEAVCMLPGARVLIKRAGFDKAIRIVDSSGRSIAQQTLPISDPKHPPPDFAHTAQLTGPLRDGRCVLTPAFGSTWYVVDASGKLSPHKYIEPGADAFVSVSTKTLEKGMRTEVRRQTQTSTASPIARGAMYIGDTVIVHAGATKRFPYHLLDYYLLPEGQYVYSRRLPVAFVALTIGPDGTFYGTRIGDETSWVMGFRPTLSAPRRREKGR